MSIHSIHYIVDNQITGEKSDDENSLYAAAVKSEIEIEYPFASVSVEIASGVSYATRVQVDSDCDDEVKIVEENIRRIAQLIWDQEGY